MTGEMIGGARPTTPGEGAEAPMRYRFRLRAASREPLFHFDSLTTEFSVGDDISIRLVARNGASLKEATNVHLEAGGFMTEGDARDAGEQLRLRLRILNAMLGLGLNVPTQDSVSGSASSEIKLKAAALGGTIIDNVWGLSVFPDDGKHFECVVAGKGDVRPSDPIYLFGALGVLWPMEVRLDQRSEDALYILGAATMETSPRARFLISFLALEPLIRVKPRSDAVKSLLKGFEERVRSATSRKRSPLPAAEAKSLLGGLAMLRDESFSGVLSRFTRTIKTPEQISGKPVNAFISACISTRNKIAHRAELDANVNLDDLTRGLRELALMLLWTYNRLSPISIATRASALSFPAGALSIKII